MIIYKYPVPIQGEPIQLVLPPGSEILCTQVQHGDAQIWVKQHVVDEFACRELYNLQWFGTGFNEVPENATYIGTVQLGSYVFHLFRI